MELTVLRLLGVRKKKKSNSKRGAVRVQFLITVLCVAVAVDGRKRVGAADHGGRDEPCGRRDQRYGHLPEGQSVARAWTYRVDQGPPPLGDAIVSGPFLQPCWPLHHTARLFLTCTARLRPPVPLFQFARNRPLNKAAYRIWYVRGTGR